MSVSDRSDRRDALLWFALALVVYSLTSPGITAYDQYGRFAEQLLQGSLSLPSRPPHLEMAEYEGRAYFTNPPAPAVLLVPFVALAQLEPLYGWLIKLFDYPERVLSFLQTAVCILIGALNVGLARLSLPGFGLDRRRANWGAALFGFGTNYWYHATVGSVWYFAQIVHALGMWICVYDMVGRARPIRMGLGLAIAYWSRMETLVALPFVLLARMDAWLDPTVLGFWRKIRWRWLVAWALPIAGVLCLNAAYNYARFAHFGNYAYQLLIMKPDTRSTFPHGLFSIHYWWGHYYVLVRALPRAIDTFPYLVPTIGGLAMWLTTPAFVFALRAPLDRLSLGCWLGIGLFFGALIQFGWSGMSQFGYRFAMDFYPLLVPLTIRGMAPRVRWWHAAVMVFGMIVNLWGVWVLNILRIETL